MHFAYPSRKRSNPPPFRPRTSKLPHLRRTRLRTLFLVLGALVLVLYVLSGSGKHAPYREHVPSGSPPVVIVTVLDPTTYHAGYLNTVRENRELYAKKHGYEAMVVHSFDYDTRNSPHSWAKILAMRHALSKYPDCNYIWYLDQHAYIMDPDKRVEDIVDPKNLEKLMIKDYPVVPPDSIIKTFSHLSGDEAALIISQDADGLASDSLILRNGDWAKFLTETWFDPLYRAYNFQKAERHALEHIVQWHPTILSKLALVPQRTIAPYSHDNMGVGYQGGDFVVLFAGCTRVGENSCETESARYWQKWRDAFGVQ